MPSATRSKRGAPAVEVPLPPAKKIKSEEAEESIVKAYIGANDKHAVRVICKDKEIFIVADYVLQAASSVLRLQLEPQDVLAPKEVEIKEDHKDVEVFLYFIIHSKIDISNDTKVTDEMMVLKADEVASEGDIDINRRLDRLCRLASVLKSLDCTANLQCLRYLLGRMLEFTDYQNRLYVLKIAQQFRWVEVARKGMRKFKSPTLLPGVLKDADIWTLGTGGFIAYRRAFQNVDMSKGKTSSWFCKAAGKYNLPPVDVPDREVEVSRT